MVVRSSSSASGRADGSDFDVFVANQPRDAFALQIVIFDQQHAFDLLRQLGLETGEHILSSSRVVGFTA